MSTDPVDGRLGTKKRSAKRQRSVRRGLGRKLSKGLLEENLLYLMVVEMPSEQELRERKAV